MFSTQLVILSQHFNLSYYRNTSTLELTLRPAPTISAFFGALIHYPILPPVHAVSLFSHSRILSLRHHVILLFPSLVVSTLPSRSLTLFYLSYCPIMSGVVNIRRDVSDKFYRYKMPVYVLLSALNCILISKVEGKGNGIKTVIPNMTEVARALSRPPMYPTKCAQVIFDAANDRHIVNGAHDAEKLQSLLDTFIDKFRQKVEKTDRKDATEKASTPTENSAGSEDTSVEAVAARMKDLKVAGALAKLLDADDDGDEADDPVDQLAAFIRSIQMFLKLTSLPKQPNLICATTSMSKIEVPAPLLGGIERLVGIEHPELLPKVALILKALYDVDLVEEDVVLAWGDKPSKKYVDRKISKDIRVGQNPFSTGFVKLTKITRMKRMTSRVQAIAEFYPI
ncbi:hypothetical protein BSLG_005756 [Batrachochytrium salamandrivorans]|nr:hypothetical protein BSLG_005756 [Batrachochytrium salamandrivorans]